MRRMLLLVAVAAAVVVGACATAGGPVGVTAAGSGDLSVTQDWVDREAADAAVTWANQLGLVRVDEATWTARVVELCDLAGRPADRSLPPSAFDDLARRFVAGDEPYSVRGGGTMPSVDEAADTLRTIALSTCRP